MFKPIKRHPRPRGPFFIAMKAAGWDEEEEAKVCRRRWLPDVALCRYYVVREKAAAELCQRGVE